MALLKKSIRDTLAAVFTRRRAKRAQSTPAPVSDDTAGQAKPLLFDTITLESIVSLRGQNPFPEEEGEIRYMSSTLRERSLLSR
jgi:hypothetical protein